MITVEEWTTIRILHEKGQSQAAGNDIWQISRVSF